MFSVVEEEWLHEMVRKPAQHLEKHPIGRDRT